MSKRLYRSVEDSKLGGVCGGIGEYFNIDPTFIRIIAILLIFADGVGILAYFIAWIIMPKKPLELIDSSDEKTPKTESYWNRYLPGAILIVVGLVLLVKNYCWWFDFGDFFWPTLLIIAGLAVIFSAAGKRDTANETANGFEEIK